jgi:hypothetical protein
MGTAVEGTAMVVAVAAEGTAKVEEGTAMVVAVAAEGTATVAGGTAKVGAGRKPNRKAGTVWVVVAKAMAVAVMAGAVELLLAVMNKLG